MENYLPNGRTKGCGAADSINEYLQKCRKEEEKVRRASGS
jgi:hypothetical protein